MNPSDDASGGGRTRRTFLGTTAALGALGLAGCSSQTDAASGATESPSPTGTDAGMGDDGDGSTADSQPAPDVPLLNYALTLEHLEHTFYTDGLAEFSDDELMNADPVAKFNGEVRADVPGHLETVRDDEAAHVAALKETIEKLNGEPVGAAEYDFGYDDATGFLETAKALENTGVAAYAGAAPKVVNNDVLTAAAGIHSVEARHASFLNLVDGTVPFPNAVDEAKSIDEVLEIAGQFVTSEVDPSAFERDGSPPKQDRKADDDTSDVDVLNYALTLEHLERAFYRDGLEEFSDDELMNADVLSSFSGHATSKVPDFLREIRDDEAAHVDAITSTVKKLGGDPVSEAEYDFGYDDASGFLGVARALENTGVAAYKGAAPTVSNDAVFEAAIGIHSVEGRHAAFLNELNGTSPFPKPVDEPKSMDEVTQIASQFIVSN
ncbi:MAG: ferritin-like domain-containing protein [Haloarculaceae archaeon]